MPQPTHLIVGPQESGNVQFGEVMHRLRDRAGFSRAEAADKLGFTSEYIRVIETGKRTPALGTMRIILKTYGVVYHIARNVLFFDTFAVEFTSRIQEARYKFLDPQSQSRDEWVGEIVRLLVTADDTTLKYVHQALRKS
jgi:transcriptional regulator with XRE-family HTH domain